MPHYLTQGRLADVVTNIDFIMQLMPEKEQVPGRNADNGSDLSKWSMQELAQECFMTMAQSQVKTEELTSVEGRMEPYAPEDVEKILPMLEEINKRCKGYLENPDYSAENRPVLNAYLKDTQMSAEMTLSGIDFDRTIHQQAKGSYLATRMLMDTVMPKTAGMDEAQRRETLDKYEKGVKDGPYFELIHAGLDQMHLAGEYEIARQDTQHPMTGEARQGFEQRMKDSQGNLAAKYDNVLKDLSKSTFNVEKYPYMSKKAVENMKESRGLKSGVDRMDREHALLVAGEKIESYPAVFAVERYADIADNELKNLKINRIPGLQEKEELADLTATIAQAQELGNGTGRNPDKLKALKEDLEKNGTTLQAYTRALQERMNRQAQDLAKDAPENEAKAFGTIVKRTSATGHYDPNVTPEQLANAERLIAERNAQMIQRNRADQALDRDIQANGFGVPQDWKAPEDAAEPMSYTAGVYLEGAMTKHRGITNGKLGSEINDKYQELNGLVRNLEEQSMYMPFTAGVSATTSYFPRAVENDEGTVINAEKEWRDLLQKTNQTVRDVEKTLAPDSKLQRSMLNYMESLTREALDPKGPEMNNSKDAMMGMANAFYANITEPGQGRNLNWEDTEKLDRKYKFGEMMQDCITMHEIGRTGAQRYQNGIVDPEKEQKERELAYRLLDRMTKDSEHLINLPEGEKKEIGGLFDQTNLGNTQLDIFGARGVAPIVKKTAASYRDALDKGWPLQEASLYIGMGSYIGMGREKMALLNDEQKAAFSGCLDRLDTVLHKDISGLDEKGKAEHFRDLSQTMKEIGTEYRNLCERKDLSGAQRSEVLGLGATQCGHGCGKSIEIEALPDVLTGSAQNLMKRAVTLGQAQPKDVAGLQTEAQRDQLEDASLMLNRSGEAYTRAAQSKFAYQKMLTDLQALKKEGKTNSDYFNDMEKALKTVAGMDGKNSPKELMDAYKTLEEAASAYKEQRSGIHIFSSWRDNGKQRRDLAGHLAEMAKADREAMKGMVNRKDPLEKPDHKMSRYEEQIFEHRNNNRGKLNVNEPLESQMLRYNSLVDRNKLPKMTAEKQRTRVEGGLEGLQKQEGQKKEKKDFSALRNSVREQEKNVSMDNDTIKRSRTK